MRYAKKYNWPRGKVGNRSKSPWFRVSRYGLYYKHFIIEENIEKVDEKIKYLSRALEFLKEKQLRILEILSTLS